MLISINSILNVTTDNTFIMDSYNIDNRLCMASVGEHSSVGENSQTTGTLSSEPLDKFINELRSDLHNELKGISSINWK